MEISRKAVVLAAIDILNREGIERLTMRALAQTLEVKAPALYWHIKNKQDLIDQIAEKMSAEMLPSCGLSDARKYLFEFARVYRQKLLEVRDGVAIFLRSYPSTPARCEPIKNVMISLLHIGVKEKHCLVAAGMYNNYVLSFVADEVIFKANPGGQPAFIDTILGTGYEKMSFDEQFECGLKVLFAGFKTLE
ncbi:MAG: TetR family transcriptional regulator [Spirochaetaceae bacterium]|jgi:TetR/AcrR family tetracycline transcriptional repressor|nr:TetR family transcriptional regulator [Spirochaetaceae bacterium]